MRFVNLQDKPAGLSEAVLGAARLTTLLACFAGEACDRACCSLATLVRSFSSSRLRERFCGSNHAITLCCSAMHTWYTPCRTEH